MNNKSTLRNFSEKNNHSSERPQWKKKLGALALLASSLIFNTAFAIDITTEDNAPFNYFDGQRVAGFSTDIVVEMARRANIPSKIHVLPWASAYQSALNNSDTCVYSTTRLQEREASFKWIGPIATNKWALFARSDFNKPISAIDDAKNYRVGGVTLDAKAMYLKNLGFTNIDLVGNDNLNLIKLMAGRIDLWIAGLYKGHELIAEGGAKNIKRVLAVKDVDYYLACNSKTPSTTINALTQALDSMQKDGFVKAVSTRYADRMTQ